MRDCGGCRGEGRHARWCPVVVGVAASQFGRMAEEAESLGDRIGANDPEAANMAYALAGRLRHRAIRQALAFQHLNETQH